jgi:chromosome segregation ATPase
MFKTLSAIVLTILVGGVLAQTGDAANSLEVAQQRARFARDQMTAAEDKVKVAEKKEKAAQKRLEEAKAEAEKATTQLQEAQAEFGKARERHDQTYKDLKRAHDASQESKKQQ